MVNALCEQNIERAAQVLREADALLIGAGAGIGVDSGLPDFRGPEGFWKAYPALRRRNLDFHVMANPGWFEDDPRLAWAFYGHRLNLYRRTEPHVGFQILREIGDSKPLGYFVFTSNVDGQFGKAGFAENRIVECHGSIHHLQCARPCTTEIWSAQNTSIEVDNEEFRATGDLPQCIHCHQIARPNVLMFGDFNWVGDRSERQQEAFEAWLESAHREQGRIAVIELGAGMAIPTVRYVCERTGMAPGGTLIRINLREAETPPGGISLPMGAAAAMKQISGKTR